MHFPTLFFYRAFLIKIHVEDYNLPGLQRLRIVCRYLVLLKLLSRHIRRLKNSRQNIFQTLSYLSLFIIDIIYQYTYRSLHSIQKYIQCSAYRLPTRGIVYPIINKLSSIINVYII